MKRTMTWKTKSGKSATLTAETTASGFVQVEAEVEGLGVVGSNLTGTDELPQSYIDAGIAGACGQLALDAERYAEAKSLIAEVEESEDTQAAKRAHAKKDAEAEDYYRSREKIEKAMGM